MVNLHQFCTSKKLIILLKMKIVIQRVARASVTIGGEKVSEIGKGLMILVGVVEGDTSEDMEELADTFRFPLSREGVQLHVGYAYEP